MPSLPYLSDTSTQLSGTYTASTNVLDNFTTSNFVIINSNNLNTKINTKQDLLTASTNLLGVGSAITNLDYNNINVNKPTNFQADWTSTIINKPTNFQADWNSTKTNKPSIYTQGETNNLLNSYTPFRSDHSCIMSTFDPKIPSGSP